MAADEVTPTLRPLEEIAADHLQSEETLERDMRLVFTPDALLCQRRLLADIPALVAAIRRFDEHLTVCTHERLTADLARVTAERDEIAAHRQRTIEFDIALLEVLGPHIGERGQSEGIIECVRRIIAERSCVTAERDALRNCLRRAIACVRRDDQYRDVFAEVDRLLKVHTAVDRALDACAALTEGDDAK